MKALNCKIKIILAVIFLSSTGLYAQEQIKELHEEFKTNESTVLNIDSKFCDLTLENWDRDEAVFDVTIKVENSNQAKAKKLLDNITVEFEKDGNEILVETVLDENLSKDDKGKTYKFSIIIVAKVPAYINLELESKFGSTVLGSFSGNADISSSFGSFQAERLDGSEISIEVSHGDFGVGKIADADIEMKFGSLHIQEAGNLSLEGNQGEVKIGYVRNLSAELNMGDFRIEMIDPTFESIDIEVNTGNVFIGVDEAAGFTFEAEMKMGNIDIPKSVGSVKKSNMGMNSYFEGKYGNGKSSISIEGNLGNIELKLK